MSRLVARILLSLMVVPLAGVVYFIGGLIAAEVFSMTGSTPWVIGGTTAWIFIAAYWVLLWRRSVPWTSRRIGGTLGCALLAIAGGAVAGAGVAVTFSRSGRSFDWEWVNGFASICAPLLWLFGTILIWRETPAERAARVRSLGRGGVVCPNCGYNLTGLSESRCPECGSRFTIDELIALQPARAGAELEP